MQTFTIHTATTNVDLPALRYNHPDARPELVTIPAGTLVTVDDVETNGGVPAYFVSALVGTFLAYATADEECLAR